MLPTHAQSAESDLETYLRGKVRDEQIPAMQVAIVRHGKIIKAAAYGTANVENGVPASAESIFSINSCQAQGLFEALQTVDDSEAEEHGSLSFARKFS
jgi:hypothetical protein